MNNKKQKINRKKRTRSKIHGTKERPRLSVFRSNTSIYAQLIDDTKAETLLYISEKHISKEKSALKKIEKAKEVGIVLGKQAIAKKIKKAVFDRGSYSYHGRIKAVADGAREGGLEF